MMTVILTPIGLLLSLIITTGLLHHVSLEIDGAPISLPETDSEESFLHFRRGLTSSVAFFGDFSSTLGLEGSSLAFEFTIVVKQKLLSLNTSILSSLILGIVATPGQSGNDSTIVVTFTCLDSNTCQSISSVSTGGVCVVFYATDYCTYKITTTSIIVTTSLTTPSISVPVTTSPLLPTSTTSQSVGAGQGESSASETTIWFMAPKDFYAYGIPVLAVVLVLLVAIILAVVIVMRRNRRPKETLADILRKQLQRQSLEPIEPNSSMQPGHHPYEAAPDLSRSSSRYSPPPLEIVRSRHNSYGQRPDAPTHDALDLADSDHPSPPLQLVNDFENHHYNTPAPVDDELRGRTSPTKADNEDAVRAVSHPAAPLVIGKNKRNQREKKEKKQVEPIPASSSPPNVLGQPPAKRSKSMMRRLFQSNTFWSNFSNNINSVRPTSIIQKLSSRKSRKRKNKLNKSNENLVSTSEIYASPEPINVPIGLDDDDSNSSPRDSTHYASPSEPSQRDVISPVPSDLSIHRYNLNDDGASLVNDGSYVLTSNPSHRSTVSSPALQHSRFDSTRLPPTSHSRYLSIRTEDQSFRAPPRNQFSIKRSASNNNNNNNNNNESARRNSPGHATVKFDASIPADDGRSSQRSNLSKLSNKLSRRSKKSTNTKSYELTELKLFNPSYEGPPVRKPFSDDSPTPSRKAEPYMISDILGTDPALAQSSSRTDPSPPQTLLKQMDEQRKLYNESPNTQQEPVEVIESSLDENPEDSRSDDGGPSATEDEDDETEDSYAAREYHYPGMTEHIYSTVHPSMRKKHEYASVNGLKSES